jgi:plastocyanin
VHSAAVHLAPLLAAEKSKVAFYIAGGALVLWALIVSLGLGLRRPDFPGSLAGQRAVGAITAVLVLAAASTAVITSEPPSTSAAKAASAAPAATATEAAKAPPAATSSAPSPAPAPPAKSPKATTGTPAPPSSPAAPKASTVLKLAANPAGQLSYNTKQLNAKAGQVSIDMANMSPIEHNVTIAQGTTVLGETPTFVGGSKTLTVKLKPGTYTFFCSVPGHRQAGMEGTLTVS